MLAVEPPAPVSAATINVTATCGASGYTNGRMWQEFNVTIDGPAVGTGQVFSTSGWTVNTGTFYYMSTSPSPFSTPYPFSGTMTAYFQDDVFNPTSPPTNPPGGSAVPYFLGVYISDPLTNPNPTFYHTGSATPTCTAPSPTEPLGASNFSINATSGVNFSGELDDHISGGSAPFDFEIVTPPTNGTVTLLTDNPFQTLAGAFRYRTNKGTAGTDSFVYKVTDSTGAEDTATASITYAAPTPLVAPARTLDVAHNGSNSLTLGSTGGIGTKTITLDTSSPSTKGSFTLTGTTFAYTAGNGQFGTDVITYRVTDQTEPAQNVTGTITVTIAPPPLSAANGTLDVVAGSSNSLDLAALVSGGTGANRVFTVSGGTKGDPTVSGSTATFTADAGTSGADTFEYTISDGTGANLQEESGTITVTIVPALTAGSGSLSVVENDTATLDLAALVTGGSGTSTFAIETQGSLGTASVAGSIVTYEADGFTAVSDSFTYRVTNGTGPLLQTTTGTISVTIVETLVAAGDSRTAAAGETIAIDLAPLVSGGTGTSRAYTVGPGAQGTTSVTGSTVTYVAESGASNTDMFTYEVTDGTGSLLQSDIGIITINFTVVAGNGSLTVTAGQSGTIDLATLVDGGSGALTFAITGQPTKGTVTDPAGGSSVTYTADADERGTDSFEYSVHDTANPTDIKTGTVTIQINAPLLVVNGTSLTLIAGESQNLDLATLIAGGTGPFTYTIETAPTKGSVTEPGAGSLVTYTADAGERGADSFVYRVTDSSDPVQSFTATVSVQINAPALILTPGALVVNASESGTIDLATLVSGGTAPYTYSVDDTAPTLASSITLSGSVVTYNALGGPGGGDTFSFTVTDASDPLQDETAQITVTVVPELVASAGTSAVREGQAVDIDLAALVSGGTAPYQFSITADPAGGTIGTPNAAGVVTYNAIGTSYPDSVSFTYSVTDTSATPQTRTATVTIQIDAPVLSVTNGAITVIAGSSGSIDLATLVTGGSGTFAYSPVAPVPAQGGVSIIGSTVTFTADAGSQGTDSFGFQVLDTTPPVQSANGTITVTILPLLTVGTTTLTVETGDSVGLDLATLVSGGVGPYAYAVTGDPANGSATLTDGMLTYTPNDNYAGPDSHTVQVTDSSPAPGPQAATNQITINVVATLLEVTSASGTVLAGTPIDFDLASLTSGGITPYTYAIETDGALGTSTIAGSIVTYTAGIDSRGADSVVVRVTDSGPLQQSVTATLSIQVNGPDLVVQDASASIVAGESATIELGPLVSGGSNSYSFAIDSQGSLGTASVTGSTLSYQSDASSRGTDTVTVTVTDESVPAKSATITVTIEILAPALVAGDTATALMQDKSGSIDLASLVSGGTAPFSFDIVQQPANGTVELSGSVATYTPTSGFSGTDSFTYSVTDSSNPAQVREAVVTITVEAEPDDPLTTATVVIEIAPGEMVTGDLSGYVSGGTPPYAFGLGSPASQGTATVNADGTFTYTANPGATGTDSFTFIVVDSAEGASAAAETTGTVSVVFAAAPEPGPSTPGVVEPNPGTGTGDDGGDDDGGGDGNGGGNGGGGSGGGGPVVQLPSTGSGDSSGLASSLILIVIGVLFVVVAGIRLWRQSFAREKEWHKR
jgi:hypothetical protein